MRRTRTYPLTIAGPVLCAALLLGACGGTDSGDPGELGDQVTALNLETGERELFDCESSVPRGWAICADARCVIPPKFPCTELGPGACLLSDQRCQLKLRCEFDISGGSIWHGVPTNEYPDAPMARDYDELVAALNQAKLDGLFRTRSLTVQSLRAERVSKIRRFRAELMQYFDQDNRFQPNTPEFQP